MILYVHRETDIPGDKPIAEKAKGKRRVARSKPRLLLSASDLVDDLCALGRAATCPVSLLAAPMTCKGCRRCSFCL
jgi:hypothetical protein